MQNMVDLICNGSDAFTPQVMVSLLVFCITIEVIGSIAGNLIGVANRR